KNSVLLFSYMGYKTEQKMVENAGIINVTLEPTSSSLQEVVVIGYGTVKKSDATGSVTAIDSKDFNRGAITSPQDLLVGKAAGVVITSNSGAPGSSATIRIRGGSSLNASNDPLIIVDGVPIDNNNISGSSNFLTFINPNDIETFTVLKDASATAIYGSRASNGVILITTKKGKVGNPLQITYDGNTSISSAVKFLDIYSGDEIRKIAFDHQDIYGAESFNKLGNQNTNWQKEIFRTAISQDHNLSLSGSYKNLPYRVSIGYTDQNGILKNTGLERYTGSINLNPSFLKNTLKVNINAKGMDTRNNFGDNGAVGSAINMDPSQPVIVSSDNYFQWSNYGASLGTANPVEQALARDNKATVKRVIGNVQLDYQLPYITGLHANLNLATDYTQSSGHNNLPTSAPSSLTNPLAWGRLNDFHGKNYNNLLEFYFKYTKDIDAIQSKIDLTGGYSWQHFKRKSDNYTRGVVDKEHVYQMADSTNTFTESYLVSFYGRLNYTLMDKYLVTFSLRDDGSSRFTNHQWGLFPSLALAWKIKDEAFIKNVNFISDLKLRLGWGQTGQQDINNDYPAMARYTKALVGQFYPMGDNGKYITTLRPEAYDPDIKWEHTTTKNIGLDYGFLNNRIIGSVDLYERITDDLLETVTIPSGSNFSNTLWTNVGSLKNTGVEISLNLIPVSKKDMSLNIGFNFTYNRNEITKLLMNDDPTYIGQLEGGDSYTGRIQVSRVGYAAHSFFMNKQVYDANGNPIEGLYVDLSGKGGNVNGNNDDKYICRHPSPDYIMGLSARFTYKKFDLSASSRISLGNYIYNMVAAGASFDQMYQIGYWHNEPKYLNDTKFVKRQFTSDYFVQNGSFFKLDNVSAGYNLDNIYKKLGARISFTVQNVFTATKYKGLDPEVNAGGTGASADGIDNNFYPRPRTFILGVSLSF
ncbi:MAG: SusC/RagA family TonB-linked outer membrane protein, partial [Bacteroidota bacterium]|nr:SusC/RagA family TonB-linked outer membrane protein [Bacteroidota bacterium]